MEVVFVVVVMTVVWHVDGQVVMVMVVVHGTVSVVLVV